MEKTGYFLSGSLSEVVEPRRIQYRFHKILKECGIDRKNFHVLRHTFATRCVEANIDIKTLSEILGHSSVSITIAGRKSVMRYHQNSGVHLLVHFLYSRQQHLG